MKYILIVMALNGSVSSVEFESKSDCLSALIAHNLAAAHAILSTKGYEPAVDVFCQRKDDDQ